MYHSIDERKHSCSKLRREIPDKNKFLTTFNEKVSATVRQHKTSSTIIPPHELRKFQDLQILDIAAGQHHILLFAVSKLNASTSFDLTSSDANENLSIRKYSSSDSSSQHNDIEQSLRRLPASKTVENLAVAVGALKTESASQTTVTSDVTGAIQCDAGAHDTEPDTTLVAADTEHDTTIVAAGTEPDATTVAAAEPNNITETAEPASGSDAQSGGDHEPELEERPVADDNVHDVDNERTQLIDETTQDTSNHTMDKLTAGIADIGDSIVADAKSIAHAGEDKLTELAKDAEKFAADAQENVMGFVRTTVSSKFDDMLGNADAADVETEAVPGNRSIHIDNFYFDFTYMAFSFQKIR